MSYRYGPRRTEAHHKSMGSYELHAWRDAMAIANLLHDCVGIAKARRIYEGLNTDAIIRYEAEVDEEIGNFIQKTERQRESFVKKMAVGEPTLVAFLTLAIIGCVRAKEILELRDRYRLALAPGSGNRATVAEIYRFGMDVDATVTYEWPWDPISAMGLDDEGDDGE